jgi:hypothetical protein
MHYFRMVINELEQGATGMYFEEKEFRLKDKGEQYGVKTLLKSLQMTVDG